MCNLFDRSTYTVPLTDGLYFEAQHPSLEQAPLAVLPAAQYLPAVQSNPSPTCFLHLVSPQPADINYTLNKQNGADNALCAKKSPVLVQFFFWGGGGGEGARKARGCVCFLNTYSKSF